MKRISIVLTELDETSGQKLITNYVEKSKCQVCGKEQLIAPETGCCFWCDNSKEMDI